MDITLDKPETNTQIEHSNDLDPKGLVAIGASAGGLEPIEVFFEHMPMDTGLAFIVIQHLSPDFKSLMDEILSRRTKMKIFRVENETRVNKNAIYLIPAKKNMIISGGKLLLSEQENTHGLNFPIDIFFRSLAQDCGKKSIAIILSGTGSDGSRGITHIHANGGYVIVQDEESASFDGMPRSAVKTGIVDLIISPAEMPGAILSYLSKSKNEEASALSGLPILDYQLELNEIFELLRLKYGIEFRYYKANTIDRRIERRLDITNCLDLSEYVNHITQNPIELDNLYYDLLIGVTRFFRDTEAFRILESQVLPKIFENKTEADEVRIWTPGCATGEEAYSIAILAHECCERFNIHPEIKIFATDVHINSLEKAASERFNMSISNDITKERLKRYFYKKEDQYIISREIRKMVIFAPQNVMSDPPFTDLDLLVCRNLLIYLEPAIQKKICALFHFALRVNGFLFLGPSESISEIEDEFDPISSQWRIYCKRRNVRLPNTRPLPISKPTTQRPTFVALHNKRDLTTHKESTIAWAYESLLQDTIQNGFLIDEHFELLHTFGNGKDLIRPSSGRSTGNLLSLLDSRLSSALSASLHRTRRESKPLELKKLRVETANEKKQFDIITKPLRHHRTDKLFFFIGINNLQLIKTVKAEPITFEADGYSIQQIQDLESELHYTREHLQATNEQLEASNEELQATNEQLLTTNEELQSTNEELQSTNEELQSTNEELHSINQELHTVNAEHQSQIHELTQLNNDMENLLTSTNIGVIFLDSELRIRKFTPAVTSIINIYERDLGRHFQDITHQLDIDKHELVEHIQQAYDHDITIETEIKDSKNRWVLMKLLPYHDENAKINGVVLTFVDINQIRDTMSELEYLRSQIQTSHDELQKFAYVASHDLQAPLRQIKSFLKLLKQGMPSNLTDKQHQYFTHIDSSAHRMSQLVDGLLQYSRVNTRGEERSMCDCNSVLNRALEELDALIKSSSADIQCSLMPKLKIDPKQIEQVFTYLIDNGIKFNASKQPKIEINAEHDGNDWLFSIRDNGIGIPKNELGNIFIIFKCLHDASQYKGNGIKLAIAKRIIERHHGRIWVESDLNQGSCFFFTLPII